jgi:PIN domain nuclease of toxin-antitoxin system
MTEKSTNEAVMSQLLDTCASAARAEETAGLSAARFSLIDTAPAGEELVSAISVAELACLQERGRITLKEHRRVWWDILVRRTRWPCLPITDPVMAEAYSLPPPDHRDPADRVLNTVLPTKTSLGMRNREARLAGDVSEKHSTSKHQMFRGRDG